MKEDEERLLLAIANRDVAQFSNVREVIVGLGIPSKRVHQLLEKWSRRGWYDYGISIDLGWLTAEGFKKADEVNEQR